VKRDDPEARYLDVTAERDFRTSSDAILLRQAVDSPAAFGEIYDRHADAVYRWLLSHTRHHELALELTAEAFAAALLAAGRYRARKHDTCRPWLIGIAANRLRRSLRRASIDRRARMRLAIGDELSFVAPGDDESIERLDALAIRPMLERELAQLPLGQRLAVELRVVDELTYDQVAARLGCSAPVARLRVFRGLRTLRARVRRIIDVPGT
jgi:RNA polymerase sigma factor (sigma-70 family)